MAAKVVRPARTSRLTLVPRCLSLNIRSSRPFMRNHCSFADSEAGRKLSAILDSAFSPNKRNPHPCRNLSDKPEDDEVEGIAGLGPVLLFGRRRAYLRGRL